MKKQIAAACCAAIMLCAGNALATVYTLTDSVSFSDTGIYNDIESIDPGSGLHSVTPTVLDDYNGYSVSKLEGTFDYVTWTHNYSFDPVYDELLSAELTLNLTDDENDCWFNWEIGLTLSEDGILDIVEVETGDYSYDLDLINIGDGSYQVKLFDVYGDFILNSSSLKVEYLANNSPAPVPEPASMVLFGVALGATGLTGLRRKIFKSGK